VKLKEGKMGGQRRAMIVSLGGTLAPVIHSLNESRPEYICFFVSEETKESIDEVLDHLVFKPRHHDWIVTANPELISDCYEVLAREFPPMIEKWGIGPQEVCVDYTGGTKTMSSALVLATVDRSCCYSYVGGSERSKGGVGVVIDGKEKRWFLDNPWDRIAVREKKEVAILFNKARYASANQILDKCIEKVSEDQKTYLKALREMVGGYDLWDRFKHKEARILLYKSRDVISVFAQGSGKKEDKALKDQLFRNLSFLESLLSRESPSNLHCLDLLANAKRRADLEKKFDDATARLYRAVELLAQVELKKSCGVESSDVSEKSIPLSLREEYALKYKDKNDGKIKIPLFAGYRLLRELGNERGQRFLELYDREIRPVLSLRNSSILAHGLNPIDEKTFHKLWEVLLNFSVIKEENLPIFPVLEL
jgi:CRISPR-associated protein (TIGR02710 family)